MEKVEICARLKAIVERKDKAIADAMSVLLKETNDFVNELSPEDRKLILEVMMEINNRLDKKIKDLQNAENHNT
jgi:uncharacterized tellurite resistance protein B-like protein